MRRCARCEQLLPEGDFHRHPRMRSGRSSWCKSCQVASTREWRARNRESINAKRRAEYVSEAVIRSTGNCGECGTSFESVQTSARYCSRSCKRRASWRHREILKHRPGSPAIDRQVVFARDGWVCQLCGEDVPPDRVVPDRLAATIDHIIPLSRGGLHDYANVQLAHFRCNCRKRERIGWTWTEAEGIQAA